MPPVHRYHEGIVTVPADLPEAVRWVLSDLDEEGGEDYYGIDECRVIRALPVRPRPFTTVRVDAYDLCLARNSLDIETLNGSPECEYLIENEPEYVQPDEHGHCNECTWCKALLLRDRIDYWLDRGGFTERNYWIGETTAQSESDWRRLHGDVRSAA